MSKAFSVKSWKNRRAELKKLQAEMRKKRLERRARMRKIAMENVKKGLQGTNLQGHEKLHNEIKEELANEENTQEVPANA